MTCAWATPMARRYHGPCTGPLVFVVAYAYADKPLWYYWTAHYCHGHGKGQVGCVEGINGHVRCVTSIA